MEITLNGERREVRAGETLAELIDGLDLSADAVIIERNGRIVERADYGVTQFASGDIIELVRMVGGG
jgi:sulfur carrier protein